MPLAIRRHRLARRSGAFLLLLLLAWSCAPATRQSAPADRPAGALPLVRVCLSEQLDGGRLRFEGAYVLHLEEARYDIDASVGNFQIFYRGGAMVLRSARRFFQLDPGMPLQIRATGPQTRFFFNDVPYKGDLTLYLDGRDRLLVINRIDIQTYLRGVVPFEIPTVNPEHGSAIYAQTVAARSYAMYHIDNPLHPQFDLYADTRSQVYRGMANPTELADAAVTATRGQVLVSSDAPARTEYHASSGGILNVPATRAALYDGHDNGVVYDRFRGDFNDRISPFYRWVERRDAETIFANLQREFVIDSSEVQAYLENGFEVDIDIQKRDPGGRVDEVVIRLGEREFFLEGFRIRRLLGDGEGNPLPSRLFFLKRSPRYPDLFWIVGAGAGHGRGMSQWGAIGLALKGFTYERILSFYYPDLVLQTRY